MHIANPASVVSEKVRVVRPGGRIVAVEPDLEDVLLDSGFVDVTRRVLALRAASYTNTWAGRRLRQLMLEAGLREVRVAGELVEITDLKTMETTLRLIALAGRAVDEGVLTPEEAAGWEQDLRTRDSKGLFACYACMFTAAARVPDQRSGP